MPGINSLCNKTPNTSFCAFLKQSFIIYKFLDFKKFAGLVFVIFLSEPAKKFHVHRLALIIGVLLLTVSFLNAQEIKTLLQPPKPGFSGSIFASGQYYSIRGAENRRSPYSYNIAGNLTFKLSVITVPVSFSFRDQQFSYGHSFNKFGISPYWKWIKVHIGHRSMRFSNYSLGGKNFFGGGLELTPGKFRFSAFAGTMQNPLAQRDTLIYGAELVPTYKRFAYGGKIGVGSRRNYFDLIALHIEDRETDELVGSRRQTGFNPVKNVVLGTDWKFVFFKNLNLKGTINASLYTENKALESSLESIESPLLRNLFDINASSKLSLAGEADLRYNFKYFGLGVRYRRIEPNYRSLGIPFLQADFENYTFNVSASALKNKINTNVNIGIERNNLRNLDYMSRKRLIMNMNGSWMATQELMFSGNFSNYRFETTDGLVNINDTLRYINVSKNYGLNGSYNKKTEKLHWGIFGGFQQQQMTDLSPIARIGGDVNNFNLNAGVKLTWTAYDLTVSPSLLHSTYEYSESDRKRSGIGINLQKSFLDKKLSVNTSSRISTDKLNGVKDGTVFNQRLGLNVQVFGNSQANITFYYISKKSETSTSFNEVRLSVRYGIKF